MKQIAEKQKHKLNISKSVEEKEKNISDMEIDVQKKSKESEPEELNTSEKIIGKTQIRTWNDIKREINWLTKKMAVNGRKRNLQRVHLIN